MSKICVNCGAELEQIAVFCDECGTRQPDLQWSQQPMPQQPASQVPQTFSPYEQVMQPNDTYSNTQNIPSEVVAGNHPNLGIASFVLGIVAVCTFGCLIVPDILGVVFSVIALKESNRKHEGLTIIGLLLSLFSFGLLVAVFSE